MIIAIQSYMLIVLIFCILIIFLLAFLVLYNILKNYRIKQMYSNTYSVLQKIIDDRKIKDFSVLKVSEDKKYDFYLETRTHLYYIKLLYNVKNYEICINNKMKWQLINQLDAKQPIYMNGVDGLMNLDLSFPTKKIIKKLYVVYPNAKSILKYINECELAFVYPDTDVYGCNVVTYQEMLKHPECIEAK